MKKTKQILFIIALSILIVSCDFQKENSKTNDANSTSLKNVSKEEIPISSDDYSDKHELTTERVFGRKFLGNKEKLIDVEHVYLEDHIIEEIDIKDLSEKQILDLDTSDDRVYILSRDKHLYILNKNLNLLKKVSNKYTAAADRVNIYNDGYVLFSLKLNSILQFNKNDEKVWEYQFEELSSRPIDTVIVGDDYIYNSLQKLEKNNGDTIFKINMKDNSFSSLGRFFFGNFYHDKNTNELYFLDNARPTLFWDEEYNIPSISYRSGKTELYKIKNDKFISVSEFPSSGQYSGFIINNKDVYIYVNGYAIVAQFDINGNYISYLSKPKGEHALDGKLLKLGEDFLFLKIKNKNDSQLFKISKNNSLVENKETKKNNSADKIKTKEEKIKIYDTTVSEFEQINEKKMLKKINKKETFVVFLGRKTCPACLDFAPILLKVANDLDKKIYYLDSSNTRERPELLKFREENNLKFVPSLLIFDKGKLFNSKLDATEAQIKDALINKN